jgi:hypothetical protein
MRRVNVKTEAIVTIPAGALIEIFQPSANFKNTKPQFAVASAAVQAPDPDPTADTTLHPVILSGVAQSRSGEGVIPVTVYKVNYGSITTNEALTLPDGSVKGQLISIEYQTETAGGDFGVLTPDNFHQHTSVLMDTLGDVLVLMWGDDDWKLVDTFNRIGGGLGPVVT